MVEVTMRGIKKAIRFNLQSDQAGNVKLGELKKRKIHFGEARRCHQELVFANRRQRLPPHNQWIVERLDRNRFANELGCA